MTLRRQSGHAALLTALLLLGTFTHAVAGTADARRYVDAAHRLYENLEYEQALEQLDRAKKVSVDVDSDVEIALYEGIIRAELMQTEASDSAFETALLLNPEAQLPVKVSPTVKQRLEDTRKKVKTQIARTGPVKRPVHPRTDRPAAVAVTLTPSPPEAQAKAPQQKPFPLVPVVVLGGGAAAAIVGGVFGMTASSDVRAARVAQYQDDTARLQQSAGGHATAANVSYGVAGAALVAAVILYFTTGH